MSATSPEVLITMSVDVIVGCSFGRKKLVAQTTSLGWTVAFSILLKLSGLLHHIYIYIYILQDLENNSMELNVYSNVYSIEIIFTVNGTNP